MVSPSRLSAGATVAIGLAVLSVTACRPPGFVGELLDAYRHDRYVAELRERAEVGDAEAQRRLGQQYFTGMWVPRDEAAAVAWYRRAAEQGLVEAQLDLASSYLFGAGVVRDEAEAAAWYHRAAEQGDVYAQTELAILYSDGRGVDRDDVSAHAWFSVAALRAHGDVRQRAVDLRNSVAGRMTPAQLAEAESLARQWHVAHPLVSPVDAYEVVSSRLSESIDIDFSAASQTLLVALQRPCRYCDDSMPFYRRLAARAAGRNDLRIVVVAPPRNREIGGYLAAAGFEPDEVVLADDPERFPAPGTPTLMAVDSEGSLTHSWFGLLDPGQEAEVLDVLFQAPNGRSDVRHPRCRR